MKGEHAMAMLNARYITELTEYLKSGDLAEDFKWSVEERRGEILEFLEMLMDLGELADETATKIIFKGQLGALMGIPQEEQEAAPETPAPAVEQGASMELPFNRG
jgi:hypothetical protein